MRGLARTVGLLGVTLAAASAGAVEARTVRGEVLYVLAEHLYDGNALGFGHGRAGPLLPLFGATGDPSVPATIVPAPVGRERFAGGRVISLAEHTTGVQVGADVTPAFRLDLLVLYDWNGTSAAFAPIVSYTGWNNLELRVGAQLFAGQRLTQQRAAFGTLSLA